MRQASDSQHTPPQPCQLARRLFLILSNIKKSWCTLATELYERLVTIYLFVDGSGRTSRLVMNLALLQNGFPIAIIQGDMNTRLAYYAIFEKCHVEHDKTDFYALIAQTIIASQQRLLTLIEKLCTCL